MTYPPFSCPYSYYINRFLFVLIFQDITRLTAEFTADGLQGRETNGLGLTCFQDRKIGLCKSYALSQFVERHFALGHLNVEIYYYSAHTLRSLNFVLLASVCPVEPCSLQGRENHQKESEQRW